MYEDTAQKRPKIELHTFIGLTAFHPTESEFEAVALVFYWHPLVCESPDPFKSLSQLFALGSMGVLWDLTHSANRFRELLLVAEESEYQFESKREKVRHFRNAVPGFTARYKARDTDSPTTAEGMATAPETPGYMTPTRNVRTCPVCEQRFSACEGVKPGCVNRETQNTNQAASSPRDRQR